MGASFLEGWAEHDVKDLEERSWDGPDAYDASLGIDTHPPPTPGDKQPSGLDRVLLDEFNIANFDSIGKQAVVKEKSYVADVG